MLTKSTKNTYKLIRNLSHQPYDSPNILIHGDNLPILRTLNRFYKSKVKCIYLDPPYNTKNLFHHYQDRLPHKTWLAMLKLRLKLMKSLLSQDGSIWISIDDNNVHYLKILCDEIFGRRHYQGTVIWEKRNYPINSPSPKKISMAHEYILVYSKSTAWKINLLPRTQEMDARYSSIDEGGPYTLEDLLCPIGKKDKGCNYKIEVAPNQFIKPPPGRYWCMSEAKYLKFKEEGKIVFHSPNLWGEHRRPSIKKYLKEVAKGKVPISIWYGHEVGNTTRAWKETETLGTVSFDTPKPEALISRILTIASKKDDLILDAFAGSGTTGAVANKMGRRWIMVEQATTCTTHIVPRLRAVVDGSREGGWSYYDFKKVPSVVKSY